MTEKRQGVEMTAETLRELIWDEGRVLYRAMPWREQPLPYYVLVSELMLQQTQVDRVIPKFAAFIDRFPDVTALAAASLSEVLTLWNGLGYNRRAKFLHEAARQVVAHGGQIPDVYEALLALPGVGPNTAGAILAYAYNRPVVFIETNVRTVFFTHWFVEQTTVSDQEIRRALEAVLDREHPREFYWALMDYGSWLKRHVGAKLAMSRHYKKQSPLKGSVREVRGAILRRLTSGDVTYTVLAELYQTDERFTPALSGLIADGLVSQHDGRLHLTK